MLEKFNKSQSIEQFIHKLQNENSFVIENILDSSKTALLSYLQKIIKKDILFITASSKEDKLLDDFSSFDKQNVIDFPAWETLIGEDIKPSSDIVGERLQVLYKLATKKENHIVISPLHSLLQKVVTPKTIKESCITLKVSEKISFEDFQKKLIFLGYKRSSIVSDKGEFAIRGGIIDIFPSNTEDPFRIEFFSDEIDNIRIFDPIGQKSISKVEKIFICPLDEYDFLKKQEHHSILLDYLEEETLIVFDDLLSIEDKYVSLRSMSGVNPKYFLSFEDFLKKIKNQKRIFFTEKNIENLSKVITSNKEKYFQKVTFEILNDTFHAIRWFHPFISLYDYLPEQIKENETILDHFSYFIDRRSEILFLNSTEVEENVIKEKLKEKKIDLSLNISFKKGYLSSGFVINDIPLTIIPNSEISHRHKLRRQVWRNTYHTPAAEFHRLEIGDTVVHFHSGIGKYLGIEKHSNHLGVETEFLIIEYAEKSKLYVPLSQSHLVSRYIGSSEERPTLSTLGSAKWQKQKIDAQKQIIGYASDLLDIYAHREIEGGFIYPKDSEDMLLFELDFPYHETIDQIKAIEAIKDDMISIKAMDRLICGDVGYGKTEVAMRAAFKAVADGKKQVAVLVPTTVLAMQHYDSFRERMANFPINIGIVSRFNTTRENKTTLEDVKNGKIDILIGTHRLLSKDVSFKDLGLLIVDEEQRFGVRAKEHLKKLKKNVDTITLSATPIPRTLYMSLITIKDMSVINTPPQDRLPIKTILAENDDEVIKNAILRELNRDGQIFFIHNRVDSIYAREDHINKLVPQARTAIVHGQMDADNVDKTFHQFKNGEVDILFSTTIIENGIDVSNANTIIIDRADTFGLADLYQLRGRVGRWNRTAYAYFLTPLNRQITEISQKRLNALLESSGYGGGMKIAMRDLEIRGAGDILGVQQSGQISSIGFHLYCKLLKKTIEGLKNKKQASFIETKMEFTYNAKLPESYINETSLRMEIYHRLGDANTKEDVEKILNEMIDRFGPAPKEVYWLLALTRIRIFATLNRFTLLKFGELSLYCEQQYKNNKVLKALILPKKFSSEDDFEKLIVSILQANFSCPYTIY